MGLVSSPADTRPTALRARAQPTEEEEDVVPDDDAARRRSGVRVERPPGVSGGRPATAPRAAAAVTIALSPSALPEGGGALALRGACSADAPASARGASRCTDALPSGADAPRSSSVAPPLVAPTEVVLETLESWLRRPPPPLLLLLPRGVRNTRGASASEESRLYLVAAVETGKAAWPRLFPTRRALMTARLDSRQCRPLEASGWMMSSEEADAEEEEEGGRLLRPPGAGVCGGGQVWGEKGGQGVSVRPRHRRGAKQCLQHRV